MSWQNGVDPYTIEANDPKGVLVDVAGMDDKQLERIGRLMSAMGRLRNVERRGMEAARRYLRLKETDMRAIHFLLSCENQQVEASPSMLAAHLGVTTASTTKLLDRLESGGHVTRQRHRVDRRGVTVSVTPGTRVAATNTVGRLHATRVGAAAKLTARQCETIIAFLGETADDLETAFTD